MTLYNYYQYYLACINDGGLHGMAQAAYREYRGELNRHSSCFNNLCAKIDRHCSNIPKPNQGAPMSTNIDIEKRTYLNGTEAKNQNFAELEASIYAVVLRLLNDEDHPSVKSEDYYVRTHAPSSATEQAEWGARDENIPKPNQGAPMSTNIDIEKRTYLNGTEAKNYSDALLITMIEQAEAEAERLRKVKTKSDKITARLAELKDGATQLAALLDARTK